MARVSRRAPLSSWTDRGLHATAGRLRRLLIAGEATRRQEYLLTTLLNEMEWRYSRKALLALAVAQGHWVCWGCDLCRTPEGAMPGQQRLVDAIAVGRPHDGPDTSGKWGPDDEG